MTHEEIFKKAIEKVVKNGWTGYISKMYSQTIKVTEKGDNIVVSPCSEATLCVNDIIFSHDFAKAFWGDQMVWLFRIYESFVPDVPLAMPEPAIERYKWHLQQMAISEDRIKYLEKFI